MECMTERIQTYQTGKTITDQFYIDDDYNVPDAKEDIRQLIMSAGSLVTEDVRIVENYIKIIGRLNFKILYVADGAEPKVDSLEGRITFEEMIYAEKEPEGSLVVQPMTTELTVNLIHSRKLNIKTLAELSVWTQGVRESDITIGTENADGLFEKHTEKELLSVYAAKKDVCRIKEEINLGGTKDNIGNIIWSEIVQRKLDTRLEADNLLLQGELQVFCFYESADGKIEWVEQTVPYEGRISCEGAQDYMYHQIWPELTDVNLEPRMDEDGEMRLLGIEAALEVRFVVYREVKLNLLEDIYSLRQKCVTVFREEELESLLMQNHSKCKVTEQLSLPEIKDHILQICHSSAKIQVESTEVVKEGLQVEGVLHICFLYVKSDDSVPYDTWQGMIPFSCILDSTRISEDMNYSLTQAVEQLSVSLLGSDEIEVRAVLGFRSFLKQPVRIRNMESVELEPADPEEAAARPGIIGYLVQPGDQLWDLAKRYSTTVEGIREVNGLQEDEVRPGEKLLIFKENMSIL